jgi:hypothetical protein
MEIAVDANNKWVQVVHDKNLVKYEKNLQIIYVHRLFRKDVI